MRAGPPPEHRGSCAGREAGETAGGGFAGQLGGQAHEQRGASDQGDAADRIAHGEHDLHQHLEQRYCPQCATELVAGGGPGGQLACPNCGFVRYENPKLAAGVVVEHDGRVLLVRRNQEPMYGRWTFPSGFVDAGEVVEEAAAREVREEVGVEVRIDRLLGVYSSEGERVVFVAYAGSTLGGTPVAGEEALEVGLFDPDALPELAFSHDGAILKAWRGSANAPPGR